MALSILSLVAILSGMAIAVPLGSNRRTSNIPTECASECPVSIAKNLPFKPGMRYIYFYESQCDVHLQPVRQESEVSMLLEAYVVFSWLSPCQVAVAIQNLTINRQTDAFMSEQFTHKPLIATIKEGVVTDVCADREDHPSSLNLKKGIISSIQNVLPNLTPSNSNKTFTETDILGRCPTRYSVKDNATHYYVEKTKNHNRCSQQHSPGAESSATLWWQEIQVALRESNSKCYQIIRKSNKMITTTSCTDFNNITLPLKHMTAEHVSLMTFKEIVRGSTSPAMRTYRRTDLSFEAVPQPKTQQIVPVVKELLRKLCSSTSEGAKKESASHVAKLIGHLNRVPERTIKQLLAEIRQGSFCQNSKRLEDLFLDAIAFAENGGAIEVMAEEVTSGRIRGGRTALYAMALHLVKKPCIQSVKAVSPLFNSEQAPSAIVLAASSLVRKYCQSNPKCHQEPAVQDIQKKLANQLGEPQCAATSTSQQQKTKVLTALKAAGNTGSSSKCLKTSILRCLETRQADPHVRAAAAEAFRHASCHSQRISELVQMALDPSENTEVRINTYLVAICCASKEQLQKIVSEISQEGNTEVRAFILSHLRNAQQSDAHYSRSLRYNLASITIPTEYEQNKDSRNIDLSYYSPTYGVGAGIDVSTIYDPGSYLLRQMRANITASLFDNLINVGEFSLRAENLEALIDAVFALDGHFQNKSVSQIITEVMGHLLTKGPMIMEEAMKILNKEGGSAWESVAELFQMFKSRDGERSHTPKLDAFVRLFGQEIIFGSFSLNLRNINFADMSNEALTAVQMLLIKIALNGNTARAMQFNIEHFIPTAQGVPLQYKIVATGVASMEIKFAPQDLKVQLSPCLSLDVNTFFGFSFAAKVGIRGRAQASMKHHSAFQLANADQIYEVLLGSSSKAKLLDADLQTYMMHKLPGQEDKKISPQDKYFNIRGQECTQVMASVTGVEFCYALSIPDYDHTMFPLGDIKIELELRKRIPLQPVLKISVKAKFEQGEQSIGLQLEAPGSSSPKKADIEVKYRNSQNYQSLEVFSTGSEKNQGRAVKLQIRTESSQHGGGSQLSAYYAKQKEISAVDEVLSAQIQGGHEKDELQAKVFLKTKTDLAHYVDADVEVDISMKLGESNLPESVDIRKCKATVGVKDSFTTTNYIRKSASSNNISKNPEAFETSSSRPIQYELQSPKNAEASESSPSRPTRYEFQSLTRTPSRRLLLVSGAAKSRGEVARETLESSIKMSVLTPSSGAEAEAKLAWNHQEKQALLYYQQREPQRPSFLANLSTTTQTPSSSSVKALTQKDDEPIYEIQTNGETVLAAEAEHKQGQSSSNITVALDISKSIDEKPRPEKESFVSQVAFNGFLQPNTPNSQRFMASASLNTSQQQITGTVEYNLDKNPQNKIELNAHYDFDQQRQYALVKGDLKAYERRYRYNAEAKLGALIQNSQNEIIVNVKTHDGSEIDIETSYRIDTEGSTKHISYQGKLKGTEGEVYKVDSKFACDSGCNDSQYRCNQSRSRTSLKGQAIFQTPSSKQVMFSVESEADIQEQEQRARCLIQLSGEELRMPVKTKFEFNNSKEHLDAKVDLDFGSSSTVGLSGRVQETKIDRTITNGSLELKGQIPKDKNYQVEANKPKQNLDLNLSLDRHEIQTPQQGQQVEGQDSVQANFTTTEESANGALELDIFENNSEKIVINISSAGTAQRGYSVEADVKVANNQPRTEVELSQNAKTFEIHINKSPSAKPPFASEIKFDTTGEKSSDIYISNRWNIGGYVIAGISFLGAALLLKGIQKLYQKRVKST